MPSFLAHSAWGWLWWPIRLGPGHAQLRGCWCGITGMMSGMVAGASGDAMDLTLQLNKVQPAKEGPTANTSWNIL